MSPVGTFPMSDENAEMNILKNQAGDLLAAMISGVTR
jgi:hypothetical protein